MLVLVYVKQVNEKELIFATFFKLVQLQPLGFSMEETQMSRMGIQVKEGPFGVNGPFVRCPAEEGLESELASAVQDPRYSAPLGPIQV